MHQVVSRTFNAAKMEQKVNPGIHISWILAYVGRLFWRILFFCCWELQRTLQPNTMSQTQENTLGKLMQECLPCILHVTCARRLLFSFIAPCASGSCRHHFHANLCWSLFVAAHAKQTSARIWAVHFCLSAAFHASFYHVHVTCRCTGIVHKNQLNNPNAKTCKEPCIPSELTKRRVTSRCGGVASAF